MNIVSLYIALFDTKPTEQAIAKFRNSNTLCLYNLDEFPSCITEFKKLKKLSIVTSNITLSPYILDLPLTYLKITNGTLTDISDIMTMTTLEELHLHNNTITTIPKTINNLKRLEYLNVSHNNISHIPNMKEMLMLKKVYLNYNPIVSVNTIRGRFRKSCNVYYDYVPRAVSCPNQNNSQRT